VLGLHLSPVLVPLGVLGWLVGTVPVLLVVQAFAVAASAWPLAAIGARRLGATGAAFGTACWFAYPNLGHVATFEFHPGTLAVLPLAWACDALDRGDGKALLWAVVGTLACREDLALCTALLGLTAAFTVPPLRTMGLRLALGSAAYAALFALVLHPLFAPAQGSFEAHFG